MTPQDIVLKIFEFVILLFSLSLHEAAHAWMASRLGDQTARMLGRVTLNPVKHIDPLGTVVLPLIMLFFPAAGGFLIGWAKPTPVNTRNFTKFRRDDILVTIAGPSSNLLIAIACFVLLLTLRFLAAGPVQGAVLTVNRLGFIEGMSSPLYPVAILLYTALLINLFLMVFNLLPLPPLDGSHIFRHMLPYNAARIYDSLGILSIFLMLTLGSRVVGAVVSPVLNIVDMALLR